MHGLQDWIHKFEEGAGVRYIKIVAALLGLLALIVVYDVREYRNFSSSEAMDAAQIARNLSEGRGYTTHFVRPLTIQMLQKHRGESGPVLNEAHPDLANAPLYPAILAGLMKVLPFEFDIASVRAQSFTRYQPEVLVAFFNQALFVVAILMVFALGSRLFDRGVGALSAVIFAGTDLFWRFSVSGLPTLLMLVLFLALVWCLVSIEQRGREGTATVPYLLGMGAAAGVLVGLGALTRYSFGWLIIPVMVFIVASAGSRRLIPALSAGIVFLAVLTPWLARNHAVSGTFFGTAGYALYQGTQPFPENRLERFLSKADFETEMAKVDVDMLMRKLLVNGSEILQNELPRLGGNWISAFFLVGLLLPFVSPALGRLRLFLLGCLLLLVVVQALGRTHVTAMSPEVNTENLLILVAPLVFIFGVGMYFVLFQQVTVPLPGMRPLITVGVAVIACAPLIFTLLPPRSYPVAYPPYWPPRIQEVATWLNERELMMSDMPWAVAWYGDRKCVWVTLDAPIDGKAGSGRDFFAIYDYQKPIQGLYLTTLTTDAQFFSQMIRSPDWAWGKFMLDSLLRTNVPTGFPLTHAVPGFLQEGQLFLSDRPRWRLASSNR